MATRQEQIDKIERAINAQDLLDAIRKGVVLGNKIVACPETPIIIPGIVTGDAFDANDCFGTIFEIAVPKTGIIYSATYWDLDDESTQLDLEIFKHSITQIASDSAWSPSDEDMLKFVTEIAFAVGDDHINSYTFQLGNIGIAYTAPEGKFYIQAVDRSTKNIAAGQLPRVQLQIIPGDLSWNEPTASLETDMNRLNY